MPAASRMKTVDLPGLRWALSVCQDRYHVTCPSSNRLKTSDAPVVDWSYEKGQEDAGRGSVHAITARADLTFTDMIQDYAARTGRSYQEVRDTIIASGAYDALYDEGTGLRAEGPDACLHFFEQLSQRVSA